MPDSYQQRNDHPEPNQALAEQHRHRGRSGPIVEVALRHFQGSRTRAPEIVDGRPAKPPPPCRRAPLDRPVQRRGGSRAGRQAAVRAAPAGRPPADQADRRATGWPGTVNPSRIRRYLGRPQVSMRTLCRRVRLVAIWQRPKLTARGDPAHDHVVAGIVARLLELPRRLVVCAEDETHLNLLPHARAGWTLRGMRPEVLTPGTNRKVTVLGALEMTTGRWVYRLGRR